MKARDRIASLPVKLVDDTYNVLLWQNCLFLFLSMHLFREAGDVRKIVKDLSPVKKTQAARLRQDSCVQSRALFLELISFVR